jgi:hypothetical protein
MPIDNREHMDDDLTEEEMEELENFYHDMMKKLDSFERNLRAEIRAEIRYAGDRLARAIGFATSAGCFSLDSYAAMDRWKQWNRTLETPLRDGNGEYCLG